MVGNHLIRNVLSSLEKFFANYAMKIAQSMRKIAPLYALQAGWVRYKNRAGMYTAYGVVSLILSGMVSGVITGASSVIGSVPMVQIAITSVVVGVVSAMLAMGYAHFAGKDHRGEEVEFGDFFLGFKQNGKKLAAVATVVALVTQLSALIVPQELRSVQQQSQSGDPEELMMFFEDMYGVILENATSIYAYLSLIVVFSIVVVFANYRASLAGDDPVDAFRWSVQNATPNFLRIIALNLLIVLISVPAIILTLGLGLLVIIPWASLCMYDAYTQLLPEELQAEVLEEEFASRDN